MGKSFGEQLRSERLDRRLTQAELGNGIYAPHEISLYETGRREPAPRAVELFAERLAAVPGRAGPWPGRLQDSPLFLALSARQCLDERDYTEALRLSGAAAGASRTIGDSAGWWAMTYLGARCLHTVHAFRDCIRETALLAYHPLAGEEQGLKAQAETLLSSAWLGLGDLGAAITHARAAVRAAHGQGLGPEVFLDASEALVCALAEAGRLDEAWEYCSTLMLPLLEGGMGRQAKGKAFWAVGNVAFRCGDPAGGLRHHRAAAGLLQPGADVELWARFNSGTAAMRLAAGIHDGETLACIEHAEAATAVVGLPVSAQLELVHSRGIWLDLNGDHTLAVGMLSDVYARREELPPQTSGEVALHLGLALARTGRPEDGSAYLADSEQRFRSVGAADRAAHVAGLAHRVSTGRIGPGLPR
ncbi:helix-turn-helix domain-containing protein [Arthrobacter zhangbolii]|uniref:Helix-turn-helix domain-containing protein n=1 Tax=Arthrobacter zhangbolii TaxID=2886936 RepID=A0A9X1M7M3_9MICC|nr:helix-turn-helix transcriptional regulator [Arthrobacter zhangbolii]MCC3272943.1 helix-turn-helix domain-containing protein [Arthrobacter zhangbolii]MCC3295279.1 helix-turn-helix domain-containing protein [Arthrobacter zhangbolii]UON92994.1 helix-turn-helix domain-containing protein [Arthrobacter zhangbolii]